MHLELWLHVPTGDRYVVLVNDAGVQQADGPLSISALQAIQQREDNIKWSKGVADWIVMHTWEFVRVWPPSAMP
jgi:hypothetical protein